MHQRFVLRLDLVPVHGNACAWLGCITAGCGLEGSLSSQKLSPIVAQPTTKVVWLAVAAEFVWHVI